MDLKKIIHAYLVFSRRDRIAILSLILIICGFYFLPAMLKMGHRISPLLDSSIKGELNDSSQTHDNPQNSQYKHRSYPSNGSIHPNKRVARLFDFDPNTASTDELKMLGFRDKTIGIIQRYRNKGGRFRVKEDLMKVYGLFREDRKSTRLNSSH